MLYSSAPRKLSNIVDVQSSFPNAWGFKWEKKLSGFGFGGLPVAGI